MTVGTTSLVGQPDQMSEALDSNLKFTESGDAGWYAVSGICNEYYYDGDAAQSEYTLDDGEESCLQAIVDSPNSETLKFYWKVSSAQGYDYLQFYIDGTLIRRSAFLTESIVCPAKFLSGKRIVEIRRIKNARRI